MIGLLSIVAIPSVTGVGQAVSAQQRQNTVSKEQEKFNLNVLLPDEESNFREVGVCLLKDGKAVVDLPETPVKGHKFCGFYFKYPSEEENLGLVSTIADGKPMLSWIYVNQDSQALEYGPRKNTIDQNIGPWGFCDHETLLTLQGRAAGFIARREIHEGVDRWGVYWDPEQTLLRQDEKNCRPCLLRRRPLLGVESSYVKDNKEA